MKCKRSKKKITARRVSLYTLKTRKESSRPLTRDERKRKEIARAKLADLGAFIKSVTIRMHS